MKSLYVAFFVFLLASNSLYAQNITQTVRGTVKDKDFKQTLPGANVQLLVKDTVFAGVQTDERGLFKFERVPVGRIGLKISFIGYKEEVLKDIFLTSAKELIFTVELQELVTEMSAVEIVANVRGESQNDMATVSAKAFSVEETERYAGTRGDPARMASNFAGVNGADDSRNDIVIRGNSPMGVLWRFEGIDIPNPNHFAVAGSQGGPMSIINNKYLANSDFYTGAFPAEYGNSLAGVFDLRMRAGNNEKHEFTGQFGIFGTEVMAEGPLNKAKGSSYLISYRYSTITMFGALGIDIGTRSKVRYQDAAFKFNFPQKNGGTFSIFGIGGMSNIAIQISKQRPEEREIYGQKDRDQYFGTGMATVGVTYTKPVNNNAFYKITVAHAQDEAHSNHEYIYYSRNDTGAFMKNAGGFYLYDSLVTIQRYKFYSQKITSSIFYNKKINSRHSYKIGANADLISMTYLDSLYGLNTFRWTTRWDANSSMALIQPYFQWKYRASEKITINAGIHNQYLSLNNTYSVLEPRAGLKWDIDAKSNFSVGTGIHSQTQPNYIYFYQLRKPDGTYVQHNKHIGMSKSAHFVVGYGRKIGNHTRMKVETYYQNLWNIPIELRPSSFSSLNQGSGFSRFFPDSLKNAGRGENYGVELTLERYVSKKYFVMLTTSLYESRYLPSDGIWRNTDFNGNYIINMLGSREFSVKDKNTFILGTKLTYAGNKRFGPVDMAASDAALEVIWADNGRNSQQLPAYFRWDIKLMYRINNPKVTHEIGIDLVNVLDTKNVLNLSYSPSLEDPTRNPIQRDYQLGRLPIFYYRIDF
jgi:hypothetical protein